MSTLIIKLIKAHFFILLLSLLVGGYGIAEAYRQSDMFEAGIHLLVAVLCFGFFAYLLWGICRGKYIRNVKRYIENSGSSELAYSKIDKFIRETPEVKGVRLNHEFICGCYGSITFGEVSKLFWAYEKVIKHRRYLITMAKTYILVVCFTDGSRQYIQVKGKDTAKEYLVQLKNMNSNLIVGYSKELEERFKYKG